MANKFPSLLYGGYQTSDAIDTQVFADINFDKLLPEETLKQLATPCPAPLIAVRQELFALLEDSAFHSRFEELNKAAVELSQAYAAFKSAQNKLETLLLFRRFALRYAAFCRFACFFNAKSELIINFSDYFRKLSDQTGQLEAAIAETDTPAKQLSVSSLIFTESATLLDSQDEALSIAEKIRNTASRLGYELPARRSQSQVRTEPFFSDALFKRFPNETAALDNFMSRFSPVLDSSIIDYRREIDFYLTVEELYKRAGRAGIPHCFPALSQNPVFILQSAYDVTLIVKGGAIIPNDAVFSSGESVWFLTGANGGGKTTYLRAVAVNLIMALAGAPVFAKSASIWPFIAIYTHFPADERFTGSGRLVEEARRADEILSCAKSGSFVFLNETYSGTDSVRGVQLTLAAANTLRSKGAFGLYVTHFHEVADADFPMLNTVIDTADPSHRTFRIIKSSALRSSYAHDILCKYGLDSVSLSQKAGVSV